MRVMIVCDLPRDPRLGSSKIALREADELERLGVSVVRIFAEDLPQPRAGRAGRFTSPLRVAVKAALAQASRCDVIDISGWDAWLVARALSWLPERPAVVNRLNGLWYRALEVQGPWENDTWLHHYASSLSQQFVFCRWERESIRRASLVRVLSRGDRSTIVRNGWRSESEVVVVHPGIDEVFASPVPVQKRSGLVFMGTWLARKGTAVFVEVATRAMRRWGRLSTRVLGASRSEEEVRAAFPTDVRTRVHVVPWATNAELAAALADAAIMLFPTRYEGFGLTVTEAMRSGVAVVTTPTGAGADFVTHGVDGLLVPPDQAKEASRAVELLLANDNLRCSIGEAAAHLTERVTWARTTQQLVMLYEHAALLSTTRHRGLS